MKECRVVRGGPAFQGKQGLDYFAGISAESVGSEAICMHMLVMPPGAAAKPHFHESHETAIYMLEGVSEFRHGPNLEFCDRVEAGDYVYIPAGVPHQPFNPSDARAVALIARTDPNEQESVVLLDSILTPES
ncbi:MAG: cupin domain-containing protein [Fimbriimonas sp.]